MRRMVLLLITAAAVTASLAPAVQAQSRDGWVSAAALSPASRLWLEGSSNVNRFTCRAEGLSGSVRVGPPSEVWEITGLPEPLQRSTLGIPVATLRCGNRRMDRDLYRALRVAEHPLMTFRLYTYHSLSSTSAAVFTVKAVGVLGLAGRESVVRVDARVERLADGSVRLRGSKPLRMTDFGIDPPTAMMGLVKAHDEVVVRFDFVADPTAFLSHKDLAR